MLHAAVFIILFAGSFAAEPGADKTDANSCAEPGGEEEPKGGTGNREARKVLEAKDAHRKTGGIFRHPQAKFEVMAKEFAASLRASVWASGFQRRRSGSHFV